MRKVISSLEQLNLQAGDIVNISLVDIVEDVLTTDELYSLNDEIEVSTENIEIELLENNKINETSKYKIKHNDKEILFVVPESNEDIAHDLASLLMFGCIEEEINDEFILKLEKYFTGENPYFSPKEEMMMKMYVYYADNVHGETNRTIDKAKQIDNLLGERV